MHMLVVAILACVCVCVCDYVCAARCSLIAAETAAVDQCAHQALGVTSDDFTNLAPLVTICCLSSLAPMPFLSLLPASVADDSGDEPSDKATEANDGRCLED